MHGPDWSPRTDMLFSRHQPPGAYARRASSGKPLRIQALEGGIAAPSPYGNESSFQERGVSRVLQVQRGGTSRCMGCSVVGATVRGWPHQARQLATGPGSRPLGHPPDGHGQAVKPLRRFQLLIVPSGVTATISYQDGDLGKGRVVLCVVPAGENCKIKHPSAKDAKHAKAHETKNEGRLGHPTNLTGNLP